MFGRWFGVDGVPWCAIFVSYSFDIGAGVVLCRGWHGAGVGPRGVAYVPTLSAWLRATGRVAVGFASRQTSNCSAISRARERRVIAASVR